MLLITGSIEPQNVPFLKVQDPNIRLKQYIESIEWYINHTRVKKIVFCENTNYAFDYHELVKKAKERKKDLEILSFQGNSSQVEKRGKGWGEGEIVEYALKNSRLLKSEDYFYKVTGRVKITNLNIIDRLCKRGKSYMNKVTWNKEGAINTIFYRIDKQVYIDNFIESYQQVDDLGGIYLEHVFYNTIKNNKIKTRSIPVCPDYIGISGTSGESYRCKSLVKMMIKHMICLCDRYKVRI